MNKQNAFTLIELMVTVAIVGILASIAIPSYKDSVMKSRRADAEGALMGLANAMERHFTETNSYCGAAGVDGSDGCEDGGAKDTGAPLPSIYAAQSPPDGTAAYDLSISAVTASTYTLTATPTGPQADDKCGTLTLTNTGVKDVEKLTVPECW